MNDRREAQVDLSIITTNWNTTQLLQRCLTSICRTQGDLRTEIIVVDNASSDDVAARIRPQFPDARFILNKENEGFSRSANRALAETRGRYLLVIHPDVEFQPGALQQMISFLDEHPQAGVVGADLYYPDGSRNECQIGRYSTGQITTTFAYKFRRVLQRVPPLHRRLMRAWYTYNWDHERTTESAMIWNACMMFRREVLEAIGPFDEQFFVWYADVDWCYRAADAGWKAYYLKGARVTHYEKQSGDYLESDAVRYKVNWAAARSRMNRDKYAMLAKHHSTMLLQYAKAADSVLLGVSHMEAAAARRRSAGAPA